MDADPKIAEEIDHLLMAAIGDPLTEKLRETGMLQSSYDEFHHRAIILESIMQLGKNANLASQVEHYGSAQPTVVTN